MGGGWVAGDAADLATQRALHGPAARDMGLRAHAVPPARALGAARTLHRAARRGAAELGGLSLLQSTTALGIRARLSMVGLDAALTTSAARRARAAAGDPTRRAA